MKTWQVILFVWIGLCLVGLSSLMIADIILTKKRRKRRGR